MTSSLHPKSYSKNIRSSRKRAKTRWKKDNNTEISHRSQAAWVSQRGAPGEGVSLTAQPQAPGTTAHTRLGSVSMCRVGFLRGRICHAVRLYPPFLFPRKLTWLNKIYGLFSLPASYRLLPRGQEGRGRSEGRRIRDHGWCQDSQFPVTHCSPGFRVMSEQLPALSNPQSSPSCEHLLPCLTFADTPLLRPPCHPSGGDVNTRFILVKHT